MIVISQVTVALDELLCLKNAGAEISNESATANPAHLPRNWAKWA